MRILVCVALLVVSLFAQKDPAAFLPEGTAVYVDLREPSRLVGEVRKGALFRALASLAPPGPSGLLDLAADLEIRRATLGFTPGALLKPQVLTVVLEAAKPERLLERLTPIFEDEADFAVRGGFVVVTLGNASKRAAAAVAEGRGKSLAQRKEFRSFSSRVATGDVRFFVDLGKVIPKNTRASWMQDAGAVFFLGQTLHRAATASILEGSVTLGDVVKVDVRAQGEKLPAGLAFLDPKRSPTPCLAPPDDTLMHVSINRDMASFWKERRKILPESEHAVLAEFETVFATFSGGMPVAEFMGAFRSGFDVYATLLPAGKPEPDPLYPCAGFVAELKDPAFASRLKLVFQTMIALTNLDEAQKSGPQFLQETAVHRGVQLLSARYLPELLPARDDPRLQMQPTMAVVGRRLIIGTHGSVVRALIDRAVDRRFVPRPASDRLVINAAPARKQLGRLLDTFAAATVLEDGITLAEARKRLDVLMRGTAPLKALTLVLGNGATQGFTLTIDAPGWLKSPGKEKR